MSIEFGTTEEGRIVTPDSHPEDAFESSLRPKSLDEYIGQERVKERISIMIAAARGRGEPLNHVLLHGPPGLGKTTLAEIIAREMGGNFRQTAGPAIEKTGSLVALLTSLGENDILFIDEIHRLNRAIEEILYSAMEDFALDFMAGQGAAVDSIRLDLPKFTLVGATTRAGQLSAPLRDRFGITLQLKPYSTGELTQIVTRSAGILGVPTEVAGAEEIAARSRSTPRIANRMLKWARDFSEVRYDGVITRGVADEALTNLEVDR
ncbi:MAG: Holliday junction branch migration DNA helicase RuvB, partial [Oscillospiraceae bacterium]|nr:Holliday junction branch migration DNA helicase RuvB [Oscillospiraceae bacterium]